MASLIKPRMSFTCRWPLGPTTNTATRIMPNFFASCQNKSLKWWKISQPPTRQAAANRRRQHWRQVTVTTPQDTWTRGRGYRVSDREWDQSKGRPLFRAFHEPKITWQINSAIDLWIALHSISIHKKIMKKGLLWCSNHFLESDSLLESDKSASIWAISKAWSRVTERSQTCPKC